MVLILLSTVRCYFMPWNGMKMYYFAIDVEVSRLRMDACLPRSFLFCLVAAVYLLSHKNYIFIYLVRSDPDLSYSQYDDLSTFQPSWLFSHH